MSDACIAHVPFSPFCTMLEGWARQTACAEENALLRDDASKLSRLLLASALLPETDLQALTTVAVADFVHRLAIGYPVLVVLDDLTCRRCGELTPPARAGRRGTGHAADPARLADCFEARLPY
jgi:hypothetical protein